MKNVPHAGRRFFLLNSVRFYLKRSSTGTLRCFHGNRVDAGWRSFGAAAEIAATVSEEAFGALKAPVRRIALPDCPAPASAPLEKAYYPGAEDICNAARSLLA